MEKTKLKNGIEHVALSFSGGGFRAAAYCLGCASYLYKTPYQEGNLLEKIKFISSASGGSITAMLLCYMLRQGKSFPEVYGQLLQHLKGTGLLDKVFDVLKDEQAWIQRPDKNRNLINAFALVYDQLLFEQASYGDLFKSKRNAKFVIDEICVNTTEFNNGLNFRFGTRGVIGNKYLYLSADRDALPLVKQIKLGDILACSSCFPAGLEPLVYPRDFSWNNGEKVLSWEELAAVLKGNNRYNTREKLGFEPRLDMASFMDGGIDDNQGIYAFLQADERERKKYDYDLYLTCDVSSNYLDQPFKYPEPESTEKGTSVSGYIRRFKKGYLAYRIVLGLMVLLTALLLICTSWTRVSYLLLGISTMLLLLQLLFSFLVGPKIKKLNQFLQAKPAEKENTWMLIFKKHYPDLLQLPFSQLRSMLLARLQSVLLLADSIYLKKIRRMSYELLYFKKSYSRDIYDNGITGPTGSPEPRSWGQNIAMTAIYLLSSKNKEVLVTEIKREPWDYHSAKVSAVDARLLKDVFEPADRLRSIVDRATAMDTTLWFDQYQVEAHALENLVIAGQATMCFNMLRLVYRLESESKGWGPLKERLLKDWTKFNQEPGWMYEWYAAGE